MNSRQCTERRSAQAYPNSDCRVSLPHHPLAFFKNVLLRCFMGVNSVTRVSGPPCHAGLSRIIRMADEASREKLRSGVPNGRESAKVLQLFDDPTQNQADQTRCAACAELPAYTTTLLVL